MIRFPDRDPTGFGNSEPDPGGTGFRKKSNGSDVDIQIALITAEKCLIKVFFEYKPDWIKYLDKSTGLGSDLISQRKYWTGLGLQKSQICLTLICTCDQSCTGSGFNDSSPTRFSTFSTNRIGSGCGFVRVSGSGFPNFLVLWFDVNTIMKRIFAKLENVR